MPKQDQLEIISPSGQIEFRDLDPSSGVTNIGRHPDNDIVIDSPGVALFHAVLDHQQKPIRIMLLSEDGVTKLGGQTLQPNAFHDVHDWDTIELDGYAIILLEGSEVPAEQRPAGAATAAVPIVPIPIPVESRPEPAAEPSAAPVAARGRWATRPTDKTDELVIAEISARDWTIDVEQTAACELTIANGGSIVATFIVRVEGLNEEWVTITPATVNLNEGARASVTIHMEAPREPTSSAGPHHLAVVVSSPNYPGRVSRLGATLTLNPYYEFTVGDLSPKRQTVSWRKRSGNVTLPISNKGNCETPFRIEGEDDERACRFEFAVPGEEVYLIRQAEMRLGPDFTYLVPARITPARRKLVGLRKRTYSFTITTSLVEGAQTPRSVMGQVKSAPLIGPLLLLLMTICLAALLIFLMRPNNQPALAINTPNPDPNEEVALTYDATRFSGLSPRNILNRLNTLFLDQWLDFKPTDGEWQSVGIPSDFEDSLGKIMDTPVGNGKYRIRADTWISKLIPMLSGASREVPVFVTPIEPKILDFRATPEMPMVGQEVIISWRVADAEVLKLQYEGIEETMQDVELESGSRSFVLEQDTTYTLVASNSSWDTPVQKPLTVQVIVPTRTPIPTPIIARFDVDPLTITEGDTVRLSWEVLGADTVSVDPIGDDFLLQGDVGDQPKKLTNYVLIAYKIADDGTQVTNRASKEVIVNPLPSATPEPVPPEIQLFDAVPKEIILGNDELVKLTWSVAGKTTDIEITAPNLKISGLEAQDYVSVTLKETTLFVLTAYNGDLSRSAPVEVTVLEPTPTFTPEPPPTAPPPPTATPLPPKINYYKAEGVSPPADKVVFQDSYETESGTVYVYGAEVGSMVKLTWLVSNAEVVVIQGFGPQPAEGALSIPDPVTAEASYLMTAENNDGYHTVAAFVQIMPMAAPPPPPPYSLTGLELPADGKVELTWYYARDQVPNIDGFRVYRADVTTDKIFEPVHTWPRDDTWTNKSKFSWTDELKKGEVTCGKAYYVTAYYWDILENREKETDSSSTSYYTVPCN